MTTETKPVQVRSVPVDLWREVKIAAALLGEPVNEFVIEALEHRVGLVTTLQREGDK